MFRHARAPRVLLALAVLLTLLPALAYAPVARAADPCVVTSVADSGAGTLRTAVDRVSDGGCAGGTVTFALPGNGPWTIGVTSLVRIDRPLTVQGPGMDKLTVRYAGTSTTQGVVFIITSTPVVLRDLTIADGRTSGSLYGAGVRIAPSAARVVDVTLARVRVVGNQTVSRGGGIYATNANLTVADSVIENNTAGEEGGGVYLIDTTGPVAATLTNTIIRGNTSTNYYGGGIHADGATLMLTNSVVSGNTARYGGGISSGYDALTLTGSTVVGNRADDDGGGIYANLATLTDSTVIDNTAGEDGGGIHVADDSLTLINSTVSRNTAADGGGIYDSTATLTSINSTISRNTAGGDGGGIYISNYSFVIRDLTATLTATTVVGNMGAGTGGGIYAYGSDNRTTAVRLNRTIAAGNTVSGAASDCAVNAAEASFPAGAYNLIGIGGGCPTGGTSTLTLTAPLSTAVNPTLADNGGPTPTHDVVPGGPAHDKIPDGSCTVANDQRGVPRPTPVGGKCDIGAVEYTATPPSPSPSPSASPSGPPSPSPSPSPGGPVPAFADVPGGYWAHDQIISFAQRGITTGCGDDDLGQRLYCPERGVTRAEMATFLTRALGQDKQTPPATPTFADVPADYWAYGQIEAFVQLGITTGCGTNDAGQRIFCPDRGVTRAEMAAFLDRAKGQGELANPTPTFADVPNNYWAYGWIERFFTLSITTGCGTDEQGRTVYCPDRGVTRAEMAVFIIRAYP